MSAQCCPVCNGKGLVPYGFYTSIGGGDTFYVNSPEPCEICRSCQGKGYLIVPDFVDSSHYEFKSCSKCNKNDGMCYLSDPPQYKCTLDNHMYTSDHSCSKFEKYSDSLSSSVEELKSSSIIEKSSSFTTIDSPKLVICTTDEHDNFPDISEYKNDKDCIIKCKSYFTSKEFVYSHSVKDWIQIL